MIKAYKYSIVYFLAFSLLLLLSGIMLFEEKIGFSVQGVSSYYLGDADRFISAKSADSILKTILPHIFGFGLFIMVILHFLIFTKQRNKAKTKLLIYLTFITAFIEISSPFLIIYGDALFSFVKISAFVLFMVLILYSIWLLLESIVQD